MDTEQNPQHKIIDPVSVQNSPATTSSSSEKLPKKGLPLIPIIIGLILFIGLFAGGYYIFIMGNTSGTQGGNNNPTSTPSAEVTPEPTQAESGPTDNVLFYVNKIGDIYSVDPETGVQTKLTDFKNKTNIYTVSPQIISKDKIGFGNCHTVTNDYGCALFTLSLPDGTVSKTKMFDTDKLLNIAGWYKMDIFAHSLNFAKAPNDDRQTLTLEQNGQIKQLEELINNTGNSTGRGGSESDAAKLSFSSDGKYLFKITTATVDKVTDYNIYVFGVDSNLFQKINDATHPLWLDNTKIIYSSIKAGRTGKLFTFDMSTSQETNVTVGKDIVGTFSVMGDLVLYKSTDKALYQFNLATNENKKILDNALQPVWIKKDFFAYTETAPCVGPDDIECTMFDYIVTGVKIYNLATGGTKVVTDKSNDVYHYFSFFTK